MIDAIKKDIKKIIKSIEKIEVVVEKPKRGIADLAIPLFSFAKRERVAPVVIFNRFKEIIFSCKQINNIELIGGFLNIYLKRETITKDILFNIYKLQNDYGTQTLDSKQTVVMDYSSPNIAKSFGIGHLRSTMIGNALKNIYKKCGCSVIAVNHLGDWGTQFGKIIVAYERWGNEEDIKKNPITELQKLYARFHNEEETDDTLGQLARDVFRALEQNDEKYMKLWAWFKEESLNEFMEMYKLLEVEFDYYTGESFYNDKMGAVVEELSSKKLLKTDQGATIVGLGDKLPPALIKRTDGATLYITRDIAAVLYRFKTYNANKALYIVGNEQLLHFKQLKEVTDLMGYNFDIEHVNFGLVLIDGKKMSTRGGKFKRLGDVLEQAVKRVEMTITKKNPDRKNIEEISKAVGIGAVIFNDLKNERHLDVDFNVENMLKFEGQTGPYLQYSSVRISSILRNNQLDIDNVDISCFCEDNYYDIIKTLAEFPSTINKAKEANAPYIIARYVMALAQMFNSFYGKQRVNVDDIRQKNANLLFIKAIQVVINEGLRLLGIKVLKEM